MTTRLMIIPSLLAAAAVSSASSFVFTTPPGSTVGDGAVSASATFVTGNGTLTIELADLLANPVSAGQLLSGLQFTLSSGNTGATLTGSSGQEINIANGVGQLGSAVSAGWGFGNLQSGYVLCVICPGVSLPQPPTVQPSHLIIGPGPYTDANGSINNNDPHNPFLNQTASFTFDAPGVTGNTTVSNVVFSFGTAWGSTVPGGGTVPEPGTMALIGTGGLAVFLIRRKRSVRSSNYR